MAKQNKKKLAGDGRAGESGDMFLVHHRCCPTSNYLNPPFESEIFVPPKKPLQKQTFRLGAEIRQFLEDLRSC